MRTLENRLNRLEQSQAFNYGDEFDEELFNFTFKRLLRVSGFGEITEKKRPHTSHFKGCLEGDRYKQPSNRLQAPYRANTKAVLTGVESKRLVYVLTRCDRGVYE